MCQAGDLVLLEFTVFQRNNDSSGTRSDWVEMDTRPRELLSRRDSRASCDLDFAPATPSKGLMESKWEPECHQSEARSH